MTEKPTIVWEKWIDPFGRDIDEAKWTDYNSNIADINDIVSENEDLDEEDHTYYRKDTINNPIKVIASPLGLIPYNEHTASSKIFNFWLGHTNFNITETIKTAIEECDGVEILDIFTRYRFRIAVGKCFSDADTMRLINIKINTLISASYDQQS